MRKYFFNEYPEFIYNDVRQFRKVSPIDIKTLSLRHEVALPPEIIKDKSILDLGACLGATGAWCLANGARHYTGIEAQKSAVEKGNWLLNSYWDKSKFEFICEDNIQYLANCNQTFDIVVAFGIIYEYVDYYNFLSKIAKVANEYIVVDCRYPKMKHINETIVEFYNNQHCHIDGEETLNFVGAGTKISPNALRFIMQTLGWDNNNQLLYPEQVEDEDLIDMYLTPLENKKGINLPTRYLTRFEKSDIKIIPVNEVVKNNNQNSVINDARKLKIMDNSWDFDEEVAERFQREAELHIPDYYRVIDLSLKLIENDHGKKAKILDVGSALGYTINYFLNNGFKNIYGVEKSKSMLKYSLHIDRIYHMDDLPSGNWDAIIANWTLHFIENREDYLQKIYNSLNHKGTLILTDKMDFTPEQEEAYYAFKKKNGVSDDEIIIKKKSLENVLITKPLNWYLEILKNLGFENIKIVNSCFMFYTIYAKKP